jgi:hypothetical protein
VKRLDLRRRRGGVVVIVSRRTAGGHPRGSPREPVPPGWRGVALAGRSSCASPLDWQIAIIDLPAALLAGRPGREEQRRGEPVIILVMDMKN